MSMRQTTLQKVLAGRMNPIERRLKLLERRRSRLFERNQSAIEASASEVDVEAAETIKHGARTFYDAADNTGNGVLGDQTDATAEKGAEMFEAATEQLCQLCDWLDDQPFEDLLPKAHV